MNTTKTATKSTSKTPAPSAVTSLDAAVAKIDNTPTPMPTAVAMPTDVIDFASLSQEQLKELGKRVKDAWKQGEQAMALNRPQRGSKVEVVRGAAKHVGKVGECLIVRKSRAFVELPGVKEPAYVLIDDLRIIER